MPRLSEEVRERRRRRRETPQQPLLDAGATGLSYLERVARSAGLAAGPAATAVAYGLAGQTPGQPGLLDEDLPRIPFTDRELPAISEWLPDITRTPEAASAILEQARQGDWDAGIEAAQDVYGAGPGFWGASGLGAELLVPGGLAKTGVGLAAKAPGIAKGFARFAPEAIQPGVRSATEAAIRGTGQALRAPWEVEEAIGRGAVAGAIGLAKLPRAGYRRLTGARPAAEGLEQTPTGAVTPDEEIDEILGPRPTAAPVTPGAVDPEFRVAPPIGKFPLATVEALEELIERAEWPDEVGEAFQAYIDPFGDASEATLNQLIEVGAFDRLSSVADDTRLVVAMEHGLSEVENYGEELITVFRGRHINAPQIPESMATSVTTDRDLAAGFRNVVMPGRRMQIPENEWVVDEFAIPIDNIMGPGHTGESELLVLTDGLQDVSFLRRAPTAPGARPRRTRTVVDINGERTVTETGPAVPTAAPVTGEVVEGGIPMTATEQAARADVDAVEQLRALAPLEDSPSIPGWNRQSVYDGLVPYATTVEESVLDEQIKISTKAVRTLKSEATKKPHLGSNAVSIATHNLAIRIAKAEKARRAGLPTAPVTPAARGVERGFSDARTGEAFSGEFFRGSGREVREDVFDPHFAQENIFGDAVYATPKEEVAKTYGPNVSVETIRLRNPLVITNDTEYRALTREAGLFSNVPTSSEEVGALKSVILNKGHDGVVIRVPPSEETGKVLQQAFGDDTVIDFGRTLAARPAAPVTPGQEHPARMRISAAQAAFERAQQAADVTPRAPRRERALDEIVPEDEVDEFKREADPSGGPGGGEPTVPGGLSTDPEDAFAEIARVATPGETPTLTLMRRHEGAITAAQNEATLLARKGEQKLAALGMTVTREGRQVIKESAIPEMDQLFKALHGESIGIDAAGNPVYGPPARLQEVYDELRGLTDWEEASRLDFDPEMATIKDYFYRGWAPSKELQKVFRRQGNMGWPPGFTKPRANATYAEMRAIQINGEPAFEPLSWNPYEQWRLSRMQGVRYRQQMTLLETLKKAELAHPWSGGDPVGKWKIPEVGPAFEGKPIAVIGEDGEAIAVTTKAWVVPDDLAMRLETLYQSPWEKHVLGGRIDLMKVIDAIVFTPKRVKLMFSYFQQVDFITRSHIGAWAAMADELAEGLKTKNPKQAIGSVKHLAVWPKSVVDIVRSNFSPNYRNQLRQALQSTEELVPGRPGIHLKGMVEAGLSIRDVSIFPDGVTAFARSAAEDLGVLGTKKIMRYIAQLDSAMRQGLFEGVYPAAQLTDLKNNIVHAVVRMYPNATDEQINGIVARFVNMKYSTIPASQSIFQGRVTRAILQRLFFSPGESEALLRQAFEAMPYGGAVRAAEKVTGRQIPIGGRQYGALWRKHWLAAYVSLIATANVIHFASTGKPLPQDRYSPLAKDKNSPLPLGYSSKFAAPDLPGWRVGLLEGQAGTKNTLDLVGQMDTAFRVLDPAGFLASRESVPVRAITNQGKGTDFFGAPIDQVGPGGIVSRTVAGLMDMFAPIGVGTAAAGIAREQIPALGKLLPPGEERIGTRGQALQATGFNVRGEATGDFLNRLTREGGYRIEDPVDPARHGTLAREWSDLTAPQKQEVYEARPELKPEIERRTEVGAIRQQPWAVGQVHERKAKETMIVDVQETVDKNLSGPLYGVKYVPEDARRDIKDELNAYYEEVYGHWDEETQRMVGGAYESEEEREEPEPNTRDHLLWRYRTRYDHLKDDKGNLDWDDLTSEEWDAVAIADNEFWASVNPDETAFLIEETNALWKDLPEPARTLLEAARYAGNFKGDDGYRYWDLVKHPNVERYLVTESGASISAVREYLEKTPAAKKAAQRGTEGRLIAKAVKSAALSGGPLWYKRSQFKLNAPTIWRKGMMDAGYHYLGKDADLDSLRWHLKNKNITDKPLSPEYYQRQYIQQLSAR